MEKNWLTNSPPTPASASVSNFLWDERYQSGAANLNSGKGEVDHVK